MALIIRKDLLNNLKYLGIHFNRFLTFYIEVISPPIYLYEAFKLFNLQYYKFDCWSPVSKIRFWIVKPKCLNKKNAKEHYSKA